jgi:hypothetical protein
MAGPLLFPVRNLLDETPDLSADLEAAVNGYLGIAQAFEAAAAVLADEQDRLRRSLRRSHNNFRELARVSNRTLNELRRVERAGKEAT